MFLFEQYNVRQPPICTNNKKKLVAPKQQFTVTIDNFFIVCMKMRNRKQFRKTSRKNDYYNNKNFIVRKS